MAETKIKYENIVPWGRSYDDYVRMFDLSPQDCTKKILSCGDGPASFNSQMSRQGYYVTSIDPIYQFSKEQISQRIIEVYDNVLMQTSENEEKFIWNNIGSIEELGKTRMMAMNEFLADYEQGKSHGRYICASLPELPFQNNSFDLVLCAHFLFFYSENLSLQFHIEAIKEMCRLGNEIRIFPIIDLNGKVSAYLKPVKEYFNALGWSSKEVQVDYEFQKGGNTMLRLERN
jgi:SAM-dependent methyltransferase